MLAVAILLRPVSAQCPSFPECGTPYSLNVASECGVDPNDASDLAIPCGVCPCEVDESLTVFVTFTVTDLFGERPQNDVRSNHVWLTISSENDDEQYDFRLL